jgi:hypothetical protein
VATQPQVPSPMHAALSALYASIQKDEPTMAGALKNTCQQMGGTSVWFGSAASSWASQLDGYSGDLTTSVGAAVNEVASALASTPPTCTAAQARIENMFLSGRIS